MSTLIAVLAFAALFALFGAIRRKPGCTGHCGLCQQGCQFGESDDAES